MNVAQKNITSQTITSTKKIQSLAPIINILTYKQQMEALPLNFVRKSQKKKRRRRRSFWSQKHKQGGNETLSAIKTETKKTGERRRREGSRWSAYSRGTCGWVEIERGREIEGDLRGFKPRKDRNVEETMATVASWRRYGGDRRRIGWRRGEEMETWVKARGEQGGGGNHGHGPRARHDPG